MMSFLRSFKYAYCGVSYCIRTQRNFRFHTFAAITALILSFRYDLSHAETLMLVFTIVFVLISEMFNTAIESIVDMISKDYSKYAKTAKDVAAGSVLISSAAACLTGILLFYDSGRIWEILFEYLKNPLFWIYAAVGIFYISGIYFKLFEHGGKKENEQ